MNSNSKQRRVVTVSDAELAARCARGRIVIIDDDADFLAALAGLIDMEGYACETYASAAAYLQVLACDQPNFPGPWCILCDVRMPELDGLELQQRLAERDQAPMILMSGSSEVSEAVNAFRRGALDFLIKPIESDLLLATLRRALAKCAESLQVRAKESGLAAKFALVSLREQDVLRRIGQGQTNIAIANDLGISLRSVKRHRQSAMEKLGAGGTAELIRILAQLGL
jgi:FixJ family two-component response regulator